MHSPINPNESMTTTIESIVASRYGQPYSVHTIRDISDDLSVVLMDRLLDIRVRAGTVFIIYVDEYMNRREFIIDASKFKRN